MTGKSLEEELGIDPAALLAKYRAERDRRLRPDALSQYAQTVGDLAHYRDDPWADPTFSRPPLSDEVEVVVVGGGLGGILLGTYLRKHGIEDIRLIERGGDVGGVWYWNRYPGAACDTQAILYLPLLEELGYVPRRKYATGAEIRGYLQSIARKYDLYRNACFQTEVQGLRWEQEARRWIVSTNRGDAIRARFVAIALGPMERPKLAGIPGIETFAGHSFHTSRWDYDYTGGDAEGGLTRLADKSVGIIGTGATAIQCVPHLAQGARHLFVFQRTPSPVDVRADAPLDPGTIRSWSAGWQTRLWNNFTRIVSGLYTEEDLIEDGWTSMMSIVRELNRRQRSRGVRVDNPMTYAQLADYLKMGAIRERVGQVIQDPAVAELLRPWYNNFCKRPCISDDYLSTFNRTNVTLVDTSSGKGVESITPNGLIADGREYPLDCLIYSTGFDVGSPLVKRIGYEIAGQGGRLLSDAWRAGAATLHGITTRGFPNLFIMSVLQSGVSLNFTHMISEQANHLAHILGRAIRENIEMIEVTQAAQDAWCSEMDRTAGDGEQFMRECTPSYFNFEGDLTRRNVRNGIYGGGPVDFYRRLAEWREQGAMPGLELTHRDQQP